MFEVDPERSWVDPGLGPITSLIQSLNTPLVAAGTHPAENVQSWILTRAGNDGTAEVFVYFHLTESNQAVLYRWDGGPVDGGSLDQVVDEAMGFCESMGFMMDNLNFGQLPPDKRGELLQTLPPFVQDLGTLQAAREIEEIPLSINKKVVDPVEEFARARAAMAESGQVSTSAFGESGVFDASALMGNDGEPVVTGAPSAGNGDVQIEITEIEGLDLSPAGENAPVRGRVESSIREIDLDDEPPLVVGAAVAPPPATPVAPPPPVVRGREPTPAGDVTVFDDAITNQQPAPPIAGAAAPVVEEEFSVDDLLSDVDVSRPGNGRAPEGASGTGPSVDIDVSSALDDILDGVESSRPPAAPRAAPPVTAGKQPAPPVTAGKQPAPPVTAGKQPAPPVTAGKQPAPPVTAGKQPAPPVTAGKQPAPPVTAGKQPAPPVTAGKQPAPPLTPEISLDIDLDQSLENSISSPDEALVALEALGVPDENPLGVPSLEPAPAPSPAAIPGRTAVEEAWGTQAGQNKANGNGARNGAGAAPVRLDISTDELARLLSML